MARGFIDFMSNVLPQARLSIAGMRNTAHRPRLTYLLSDTTLRDCNGSDRLLRRPGLREEHVLSGAVLRDPRAAQPGHAASAHPGGHLAARVPGGSAAVRGGQHEPHPPAAGAVPGWPWRRGSRPYLYCFESTSADALSRNAARPEPFRVPDLAILGTLAKLEWPSPDEGFSQVYRVRVVGGCQAGAGNVGGFDVPWSGPMKFDEPRRDDAHSFETANDRSSCPASTMSPDRRARLHAADEGVHAFEAPFELPAFRDMMLATTEHLISCGFDMPTAIPRATRFPLLFRRGDNTFGRKTPRVVVRPRRRGRRQIFAAARRPGRVRLPRLRAADAEQVRDYFRWRSEDAHRNRSGPLLRMLRNAGRSVAEATAQLSGTNVADKNELLFQAGINFNEPSRLAESAAAASTGKTTRGPR